MVGEVESLPCAAGCGVPVYGNYKIANRAYCEICTVDMLINDGAIERWVASLRSRTTSGRARGVRTNGTPPAVGTARPVK
jgi:hypothetical protein